MANRKSTIVNRKSKGHYRCKNHPDRYPAVVGKCWECLLGAEGYKRKFKELAESFYQPDGPGYAGPIE